MKPKFIVISVIGILLCCGGAYVFINYPELKASYKKLVFYYDVNAQVKNYTERGGVLQSYVNEEEEKQYIMLYDESGIYIKDFINPDVYLVKVGKKYQDCGYALRLDSIGGFYVEQGSYTDSIKIADDENSYSYGDEIASVIENETMEYSNDMVIPIYDRSKIIGYGDQTATIEVDEGVYYLASRNNPNRLYRVYSGSDDLEYKTFDRVVENLTGELIDSNSCEGFRISVQTSESLPQILSRIPDNSDSEYSESPHEVSASEEVNEYFDESWSTGMYSSAVIDLSGEVVGRDEYSYIIGVDEPSSIENILSEDVYFMYSDVRRTLFEVPSLKLKDLVTKTNYGDWKIEFADDGFGEKLLKNPYCYFESKGIIIEIYPYRVVVIKSPCIRETALSSTLLNKIKVESLETKESIYITPSLLSNEHDGKTGRFSISYDDDVSRFINLLSKGDLKITMDVTESAFFFDSDMQYEVSIIHNVTNFRESVCQMAEIYDTAKKVYN